MNSPEVKRHAKDLADGLQRQATDPSERLGLLWRRALNRPITPEEKTDAEAFLRAAGQDGWIELCHALLASNEFLIRL